MFPFGSSDPKQMHEMLKKMGVKSREIEADEVIIRKGDRKLVIKNPQVNEIEFSGKKTFQIFGDVSVEEGKKGAQHSQKREEIEISEKDVKFVADTTKMPEKKAREALIKSKGDIAKAVLILKKY